MALIVNDRVKETSTTTGTGTLNLAGAEQGYETFVSGIGTTNTTFYAIENNQAWDLMPFLVPKLALCFHMLQRELNLHCIEVEYEKS